MKKEQRAFPSLFRMARRPVRCLLLLLFMVSGCIAIGQTVDSVRTFLPLIKGNEWRYRVEERTDLNDSAVVETVVVRCDSTIRGAWGDYFWFRGLFPFYVPLTLESDENATLIRVDADGNIKTLIEGDSDEDLFRFNSENSWPSITQRAGRRVEEDLRVTDRNVVVHGLSSDCITIQALQSEFAIDNPLEEWTFCRGVGLVSMHAHWVRVGAGLEWYTSKVELLSYSVGR